MLLDSIRGQSLAGEETTVQIRDNSHYRKRQGRKVGMLTVLCMREKLLGKLKRDSARRDTAFFVLHFFRKCFFRLFSFDFLLTKENNP